MLSTPTLPSLLKRYEALTREIAAREAERVAIHDQILAAGRGPSRRGAKTSGPGRPARTTAQTVEVVRDAVRVLREAGEPLPRRGRGPRGDRRQGRDEPASTSAG